MCVSECVCECECVVVAWVKCAVVGEKHRAAGITDYLQGCHKSGQQDIFVLLFFYPPSYLPLLTSSLAVAPSPSLSLSFSLSLSLSLSLSPTELMQVTRKLLLL